MTLSIAAIAGPTPSVPPRAGAATGDFALSLSLSLAQVAGAAVAVAVVGKDGDPPAKDAAPDDHADTRQDDAADGNALPSGAATPLDPSLLAAWLPVTSMPVPTPLPTPVAVVADPAAAPAAIPAQDAANATPSLSAATPLLSTATPPLSAAAPLPVASTAPAVTMPDPAMVVPVAPAPASPAPTVPAALVPQPNAAPAPIPLPTAASAMVALAAPVSAVGVTITAVQAPSPTDPAAPTQDQVPTASAPQIDTRAAPVVALPPAQAPVPLPSGAAAAATATPAIQVFGSAMRAGLAKDAAIDPATGAPTPTVTTHAAATPAIAATGEAQQAPLDLRRENWPHAMIDRIEALRDAADATSTKIRVVPDALGPVEMSVRKDGDTLHVHFAADQAQTRTMLTEAQPRLAAIAEQRGLRLGGSSVDTGSAGNGQQQPRPSAQAPLAPPPSTPAAEIAADDDSRIA